MAERKTCANPGCEKKFTAKHNNKRYCTVQCSRKAQHKRSKAKKQKKANVKKHQELKNKKYLLHR